MKLRRSMLLVPSSDKKKVLKAQSTMADVLLFDLQDSVPFDNVAKKNARISLASGLKNRNNLKSEINIRVNAIDSPWIREDLEMAISVFVDSVTFAELRTSEDLIAFEQLIHEISCNRPRPKILLDIETPAALCNLERIADAATLVDGMMIGVNDYALEVHSSGSIFGQNGEPSQEHLTWLRPKSIAVARMHNWTISDAVMMKDPRDVDAVQLAMNKSKLMGFDGWVVLFPPQVISANQVFCPTLAEVEWANEVVNRYKKEQSIAPELRVATVPRQHLQLARYQLERHNKATSIE